MNSRVRRQFNQHSPLFFNLIFLHLPFTGVKGQPLGHLSRPAACALSPDGQYVYITDQGNGRVVIVRASDGAFEAAFGATNPRLSMLNSDKPQRDLAEPCGIAFSDSSDVNGVIWVSDRSTHTVQGYLAMPTLNFPFVTHIGETGEKGVGYGSTATTLHEPCSIATWKGRVFVADCCNHRVQVGCFVCFSQ